MGNWAIQTNLVDQQRALVLAQAVRDCGGRPYEVSVIPFSDDLEVPEPMLGQDIIAWGSTKLIQRGLDLGWTGVFFNGDFRVPVWTRHRRDMLNQETNIFLLSDVIGGLHHLEDDEEIFVRPCEDLKAFPGQVTTVCQLRQHEQSRLFGSNNVNAYTWIAVSRVQKIDAEYRCFVVGSEVVDCAQYRSMGRRVNVRIPVAAGYRDKASDWLPHETCVMDLALVGGDLKVIEFNCINASGFYGHDIPTVVQAVNTWFDGSK